VCAEGDESYIVCRRGENIKKTWQAIYDDPGGESVADL
jgi:hypothetical protein